MSLAVRRYSDALLEVCVEENCLEEAYSQYRLLVEQLKADREFERLLLENILSSEEKKELIEKVLPDGNPYLISFLKTLADRGRMEEMEEMFLSFEEGYKEKNNILEAEAVTAVEMTKEQIEDVKKTLSEKYGKTIVLKTSVDPSIIGGMVLTIGNKMFDASVKAKFDSLKKQLKTIQI